MKLNLLLHILNKKQKKIIDDDIKLILSRCNSIAQKEYIELKETKKKHDSKCPNCGSCENIVNKISYVYGKTNTTNTIIFGFTLNKIENNIETQEINHCNKCGNQWTKGRIKYISGSDILRVTLNYLFEILNNSNNEDCDWKLDAVKVFDGCYAESIFKLKKKNYEKLHNDTRKYLTLKLLKSKYKSIYNKK